MGTREGLLVTALFVSALQAGCGENCQPRVATVCENRAWYWVDSCGRRELGAECDCTCDFELPQCLEEPDPWEQPLDAACHDRTDCLTRAVGDCINGRQDVIHRSSCPEWIRCMTRVVWRDGDNLKSEGLGASFWLDDEQVTASIPCSAPATHDAVCVLDTDPQDCIRDRENWTYICRNDVPEPM